MQFQELLPQLKLIVGLGNVGSEYVNTRHNAGFLFVDQLHDQLAASAWKEEGKFKSLVAQSYAEAAPDRQPISHNLLLAKPTTLMNRSGAAVRAVMDYYQIAPSEILVAHDDMDIRLGSAKLQWGRGPKMHNGIASVDDYLGTEEYYRLRIGIENRSQIGNKGVPGIRYALERFTAEELTLLTSTLKAIY